MDVDGVVSPLDEGRAAWGDEVHAGDLFGPVIVSPSLCERLDHLAAHPFVDPWWLTSWTSSMRGAMRPFPGTSWRAAVDPQNPDTYRGRPTLLFAGESWWKWEALARRVLTQENLVGVVWCDDHLGGPDATGSLKDGVQAELDRRGLDSLLLAPNPRVGLTPHHLDQIEAWLAAHG